MSNACNVCAIALSDDVPELLDEIRGVRVWCVCNSCLIDPDIPTPADGVMAGFGRAGPGRAGTTCAEHPPTGVRRAGVTDTPNERGRQEDDRHDYPRRLAGDV